MNVIEGPGRLGMAQVDERDREYSARSHAMNVAIEWARSAGPEHCTRVPPDEMVKAATAFLAFLQDGPPKT